VGSPGPGRRPGALGDRLPERGGGVRITAHRRESAAAAFQDRAQLAFHQETVRRLAEEWLGQDVRLLETDQGLREATKVDLAVADVVMGHCQVAAVPRHVGMVVDQPLEEPARPLEVGQRCGRV
jgi:hypothetical protein